jgi:glycosyltransferase involved in cell wall biosynthesis
LKRLITVNSNKSTTMGGVETLIRDLQESTSANSIIELFEHAPLDEYFTENTSAQYSCFGLSDRGLLAKIKTKLRQWQCFKKLNVTRDDTIVFFHPNDLLYIPLKALSCSKIILVQTNKFDIFFEKASNVYLPFISKYINLITVYTDKDAKVLSRLAPQFRERTKIIPRGCKLQASPIPSVHSKKLVTIARIDEGQKNFSEMIRVIENLPSDYTLDIYGGGSREEVKNLEKLLINNKKVRYQGATSDVRSVLENYAVFLMTSRYEGFGQTLIEARSQGLPIVAYNTFDALTWVINDGVTGFAVNEGDRENFCQRIVDICSSESAYETMSRAALIKSQETKREKVNQTWRDIL